MEIREIIDTLQVKLNEYERDRDATIALHEGLSAIQAAESRVQAATEEKDKLDVRCKSLRTQIRNLEVDLTALPQEIEQKRRDGLAALEVEFASKRAPLEKEISQLEQRISELKLERDGFENVFEDVKANRNAEIAELTRQRDALRGERDALADRLRSAVA